MSLSPIQLALQRAPAERVLALARQHGLSSLPWEAERRPEQVQPDGDWSFWLMMAGRGFGKTRTGAETVREWVTGGVKRIGVAGRTVPDVREAVVEGESGLLAVFAKAGLRATYKVSKRRVDFGSHAFALTYSADKPDVFRGPQFEKAWCDELAAWRYCDEAFANLKLALRLGSHPQAVITTTPRPIPVLRTLLANKGTVVTKGTTYDNRSNLPESWYRDVVSEYEGTRRGRQELLAEMLDDNPGALWSRAQLEELRVNACPVLTRTVVGIDPAESTTEQQQRKESDGKEDRRTAETGIVCAGVGICHCKGYDEMHAFVLEDVSGRLAPLAWASAAISIYHDRKAERIVAERNAGGEMVESNLRTVDSSISYASIWASESKRSRAEPIAALYEQGKVHHVGMFAELEDQMCTWEALTKGERSPDRMDALVHTLTELSPIMRGRPAGAESFKFGGGEKRRM